MGYFFFDVSPQHGEQGTAWFALYWLPRQPPSVGYHETVGFFHLEGLMVFEREKWHLNYQK